MKNFVLAAFLCVLVLPPAYAQEETGDQSAQESAQQPQEEQSEAVKVVPGTAPSKLADIPAYEAPKSVHYGRTGRLERPIDPIIGYRNAENVVFLDVSYSDLPAAIRADAENALGNCPDTSKSTAGIKAYSYVSDWLRARGLSQNYVLDFSGLSASVSSCAPSLACNDDGCVLMTYNSYSYNQWKRDAVIRNKSWTIGTINDPRANGVPQNGKATPIAVFDITARCEARDGDAKTASGDTCHSYRMWTIGGLANYSSR